MSRDTEYLESITELEVLLADGGFLPALLTSLLDTFEPLPLGKGYRG